MSTTFVVKFPSEFDGREITVDVAHSNSERTLWLNELSVLLSDETPVEAIGDGVRGIFTIGDLKNIIKED